MSFSILIARCIRGTITAYPRWLLPAFFLRILPLRLETGFRLWRRWLAPHRQGNPAARRAADANFMILTGISKSSRLGRRAALELILIPLAPLYAVLVTVFQVSRHGRSRRTSNNTSLPRQLLDVYRLHLENPAWLFEVHTWDWYFQRGFHEPAMAALAPQSIPNAGRLIAISTGIWARNQDRRGNPRPSDRKSSQAERLRRAGVPTIPLIAKLGCGRVEFQSGHEPGNLLATPLFAKPDAGYQGKGALAWECRRPGVYIGAGNEFDGREWSVEDILNHLRNLPYLSVLQPRLSNHPDLIDLTGDTLCGTRIVTFTDPVTLAARVFPRPFMKIPRIGAIADNLSAPSPLPGMAAGVDMASGTLGPALAADLTWLREHPDRGSRIEGRRIPHWRESVDLALKAHQAFRPHGWAWGWDIAVTGTGPLVVEGNSHPGSFEEFFKGKTFGEVEEIQALIDLCLLAEKS